MRSCGPPITRCYWVFRAPGCCGRIYTFPPRDFTARWAQLHAIPFRGLPKDGQPMPGTLLYDAVYLTAMGKLKGVPGARLMLNCSDGLDNGSRMHMEEALEAVQATNTNRVWEFATTKSTSAASF